MKLHMIDQSMTDLASTTITIENEMIQEALDILDRRLFTSADPLVCPGDVAAYLKLKLTAEVHEAFGVIFLNAKHQPLAFEILFRGSAGWIMRSWRCIVGH